VLYDVKKLDRAQVSGDTSQIRAATSG